MQLRFGLFEFETAVKQLRRDGALVKLQAQPAEVLRCLLERPGEVVSREELRQALWRDDTFVDFERGLNFCVAQIRAALNDTASEPRYIRTVPKRGYQFIAPVMRNGKQSSQQSLWEQKHGFRIKMAVASALGCVVLIAGFAAGYLLKRSMRPPNPIVAVLRFDNETGNPDMLRFSDAITDLLVTELTAKADGHYRVIGNAQVLRLPREQRDLGAVASSLGASCDSRASAAEWEADSDSRASHPPPRPNARLGHAARPCSRRSAGARIAGSAGNRHSVLCADTTNIPPTRLIFARKSLKTWGFLPHISLTNLGAKLACVNQGSG